MSSAQVRRSGRTKMWLPGGGEIAWALSMAACRDVGSDGGTLTEETIFTRNQETRNQETRNHNRRNLISKGLAYGQETARVKFMGPVGFGDGQQVTCQGVGSDQWVALRVLTEGKPGDGGWPVVDLVIMAQKCRGNCDA